MPEDIEDKLFLSLEKYYGKPIKKNKKKYRRRYRYECIMSKYIKNYKKSWDRFNELYNKYRKD